MTGDVTLISGASCHRRRLLPVRELVWLADTPRQRSRSPITQPGYRKGCKPGNAGRTFAPDPLTPDETLRLLDACPSGKCGVRNRALIAVLWRSGLRIHEALLLKPHHINFETHEVTVLRGKGGKRRSVGIDDGALAELRVWLSVRDTLELPADAPLFCTVSQPNPGRPLYGAYTRKVIHSYGKRAGIPRRCHPHGLRHGLAVELVREGAPMPYIQRQLGHSSLSTTANYLVGLGAGEHVEFVAARKWPGSDPAWASVELAPGVERAPEPTGVFTHA